LIIDAHLEPDMPKAVRVSTPIHPLVSIALFSGIGLLASLITVVLGIQAIWC